LATWGPARVVRNGSARQPIRPCKTVQLLDKTAHSQTAKGAGAGSSKIVAHSRRRISFPRAAFTADGLKRWAVARQTAVATFPMPRFTVRHRYQARSLRPSARGARAAAGLRDLLRLSTNGQDAVAGNVFEGAIHRHGEKTRMNAKSPQSWRRHGALPAFPRRFGSSLSSLLRPIGRSSSLILLLPSNPSGGRHPCVLARPFSCTTCVLWLPSYLPSASTMPSSAFSAYAADGNTVTTPGNRTAKGVDPWTWTAFWQGSVPSALPCPCARPNGRPRRAMGTGRDALQFPRPLSPAPFPRARGSIYAGNVRALWKPERTGRVLPCPNLLRGARSRQFSDWPSHPAVTALAAPKPSIKTFISGTPKRAKGIGSQLDLRAAGPLRMGRRPPQGRVSAPSPTAMRLARSRATGRNTY